jgi:hypothetical protein
MLGKWTKDARGPGSAEKDKARAKTITKLAM